MCDTTVPDAYVETTRRARKPHWCCECSADIAVGERYVYSSGVWDGRGNSHKTCLRCADARDKAMTATRRFDACEPPFGALADWFAEVFDLSGEAGDVIDAGVKRLSEGSQTTTIRLTPPTT